MTLTPIHLRILLHYYSFSERYPNGGHVAPKATIELCEAGLLDFKASSDDAYYCTPRGKAHIQQLLSLPLPQQAWVGADGAVIQM